MFSLFIYLCSPGVCKMVSEFYMLQNLEGGLLPISESVELSNLDIMQSLEYLELGSQFRSGCLSFLVIPKICLVRSLVVL